MTHKVSTGEHLVFGTNYKHEQKGETLTISSLANVVPVPDSILLTREQFNELRAKIAGDAFEAGYNRCNHCYMVGQVGIEMNNESFPDKQQYLSSLNSKENELDF